MKNRLAVLVVASIVGLGACTTVGSSPATAPPITEPPTTSSTIVAPTTVIETTTTVDRIAEIQAIFQNLERRRLQAIMDQDEKAFRAVFANPEYEERSVGGMALVTVIDPRLAVFTVVEVFVDDSTCIAVEAFVDGTLAIRGANIGLPTDYVVERGVLGWGFSWAGSGWRCEGPHPFSD
jgi:hypothetical protein